MRKKSRSVCFSGKEQCCTTKKTTTGIESTVTTTTQEKEVRKNGYEIYRAVVIKLQDRQESGKNSSFSRDTFFESCQSMLSCSLIFDDTNTTQRESSSTIHELSSFGMKA